MTEMAPTFEREDARETLAAVVGRLEEAARVLRALDDPAEAERIVALSGVLETWARAAALRRERGRAAPDEAEAALQARADAWRAGLDAARDGAAAEGAAEGRLVGGLAGLDPAARIMRTRALVLALLGSTSDAVALEGGADHASGALAFLAADLAEQLSLLADDVALGRGRARRDAG